MNYKRMVKNILVVTGLFTAPLFTTAQENQEANFVKTYLKYYDSIQYFRPYNQDGINQFETKKEQGASFQGLRVRFGAGFTQQFQALNHESSSTVPANKLYPLSAGFNTAQANLNMDVQLADGIRLNLVTYLSARHHNEAWVKGGYIQFDKLPFKGKFWDDLMKYTTIKIGHMEINYGDQHFRRSDGGQTLYNPFMENYIVDAFTTEIGGEVYLNYKGLFGMVGMTNGEIKGDVKEGSPSVSDPDPEKSPAIYLKGGLDKQLGAKTRVRVAASYYTDQSSSNNTLFWGDRTGSNYFLVLEKEMQNTTTPATATTATAQAWSGRLNPGFGDKTQGIQLNAFVKYAGLEFFGTYENGSGQGKAETKDRQFDQWAGELVYRAGKKENIYFGYRYNTVSAELAGVTDEVDINRHAFAAGWFLTKNILLKGEYVKQEHKNYPLTSHLVGGKFDGFVIEAVVGF